MADRSTRSLAERFWGFVDKSDSCWLWIGAVDKATGYGRIGITSHGTRSAHRVSYELNRAPIPDGMYVCSSLRQPALR